MSLLRKKNAIIFLLGAGASYNAKIPISSVMIHQLEKLIDEEAEFRDFYSLYHYIKCAINYGSGIQKSKLGSQFESFYNIESLVMTLDELAKKDEHLLYPFIGAWNPKLMELTQQNFSVIKDFKDKIVGRVRKWVKLERDEDADYYQGLIKFQANYQHPLRIFSLNYDLCVENAYAALNNGAYPERGFYPRRYPDSSQARTWSWQLLDEESQVNEEKTVLLYKLHGSIDWKRHSGGRLTFEDGDIDAKDGAIIFGTAYKLQYYDPFLYLFQEFRKWSLQAKLIICTGYGFYDEHINSILGQALNNVPEMKLLSIAPVSSDLSQEATVITNETTRIERALNLNGCSTPKVIVWNMKAEDFMEDKLKIDELSSLFPLEDQLLPEIVLDSEDGPELAITEE